MNERTFDSVINSLNSMVSEKRTIDPHTWVEAAQYINLFLEDEQNALFLLEQRIAQMKCELLETGKSVAEARTRVEASEDYLKMRQQKARIERAIELIRISKLQSRTSVDVLRSN